MKMTFKVVHALMVVFSISFVTACGSTPKQPEAAEDLPAVNLTLQKKFNDGLAALGNEEYAKAARIFDEILVENPASEFDLTSLYNSGAAHEGMGECRAAGRRYRQVAQIATGRFPRLEAQAVFRLSYIYECLGFTEKVVSSLMDAYRRKEFLPDEIVKAEIPARLASAYAQLGQIEIAKKFFTKAEEGIQSLRRVYSERVDLTGLLARTYYFMGRVQKRQDGDVDPDSFFQGLRFQQTHLIKAVELGVAPWSRKASDGILEAYRSMWALMDAGKARRNKASYPEKRAYVQSWLENALQAIAEIKTLRFPGAREGAEAKRLFSQLEEEERRTKEFLADFAVSHPLTPEAEKREGLKREGRIK